MEGEQAMFNEDRPNFECNGQCNRCPIDQCPVPFRSSHSVEMEIENGPIPDFIRQLLMEAKDEDENPKISHMDDPDIVAKAKAAAASYNKTETFHSGDLLVYKEGLALGQVGRHVPVVFLEYLPEEVLCRETEVGTPMYLEPLDMRIITGYDQDLGIFHIHSANSKRFTKYTRK